MALFNKEEKAQIERDMWRHLKCAAEAIEKGDRAAIAYEQAALSGLLDLQVREERHVRLVKNMIGNCQAELRKK